MVRMVHRIFQDQFPWQSLSSKIKHPGETWPESYGKGIFFGWFSKLEEKQAHKQKQQKNEHRSRPRFSGSGYVAIRWKRHKTIPRAAKRQRPSSSSPDVLLSSLTRNQPTRWLIFVGRPWFLEAFGVLYFHDPCLKPAFKNDECDKPKPITPCFFLLAMAIHGFWEQLWQLWVHGVWFSICFTTSPSRSRVPTASPDPLSISTSFGASFPTTVYAEAMVGIQDTDWEMAQEWLRWTHKTPSLRA